MKTTGKIIVKDEANRVYTWDELVPGIYKIVNKLQNYRVIVLNNKLKLFYDSHGGEVDGCSTIWSSYRFEQVKEEIEIRFNTTKD